MARAPTTKVLLVMVFSIPGEPQPGSMKKVALYSLKARAGAIKAAMPKRDDEKSMLDLSVGEILIKLRKVCQSLTTGLR